MNKEHIQGLFDKAVGSIMKQGSPCSDDMGCVYKSGNHRCVVGHLLNEDIDPHLFNSIPVMALFEQRQASVHSVHSKESVELLRNALEQSNISTDEFTLQFLDSLQNVHDVVPFNRGKEEFMKRWKESFSCVADTYGLNTNVLANY